MSLLFTTPFDHVLIHVLHLRGRPALLAHEIGTAAGSRDGGQSFVRSIRLEWAESLHDDDDVAEITGNELDAIKREIPSLGDTSAVLVLFPSGVEKALSRCHARHSRSLLGFLHAEVYSRVATIPAPRTPPTTPAAAATAPRRIVLALEPDVSGRFQLYWAVRVYAALILKHDGNLDDYLNLERQALELLLGREINSADPAPSPAANRSPIADAA